MGVDFSAMSHISKNPQFFYCENLCSVIARAYPIWRKIAIKFDFSETYFALNEITFAFNENFFVYSVSYVFKEKSYVHCMTFAIIEISFDIIEISFDIDKFMVACNKI